MLQKLSTFRRPWNSGKSKRWGISDPLRFSSQTLYLFTVWLSVVTAFSRSALTGATGIGALRTVMASQETPGGRPRASSFLEIGGGFPLWRWGDRSPAQLSWEAMGIPVPLTLIFWGKYSEFWVLTPGRKEPWSLTSGQASCPMLNQISWGW